MHFRIAVMTSSYSTVFQLSLYSLEYFIFSPSLSPLCSYSETQKVVEKPDDILTSLCVFDVVLQQIVLLEILNTLHHFCLMFNELLNTIVFLFYSFMGPTVYGYYLCVPSREREHRRTQRRKETNKSIKSNNKKLSLLFLSMDSIEFNETFSSYQKKI